eukprot:tig00000630_g2703.t1
MEEQALAHAHASDRKTPDSTKQRRCRFSTKGPFQLATSADSAFWVSQAGRLFRWRLTLLDAPGCDEFEEEQLPELPVSGLHHGARDRLKQVACGANFVFALSEEGVLFARAGGYSQSFLRVPYKAPVAAVSAGHAFAALLTAGGEVATWGDNSYGQLGHGPAVGPLLRRPTAVKSLQQWKPCVKLACGPHHVVVIDTEDNVIVWGCTGLPRSDADRMRAVPGVVPGAPRDVVQVACGGAIGVDGHTALLTAHGKVFTFGRAASVSSATTTDSGRRLVLKCSAGATYLRAEDGELYRFGSGQYGLQQLITNNHVADIVSSSYHTIAICVVRAHARLQQTDPDADLATKLQSAHFKFEIEKALILNSVEQQNATNSSHASNSNYAPDVDPAAVQLHAASARLAVEVPTDPRTMRVADVSEWLRSLDLGMLAASFENNCVDGMVLLTLTDADLQGELGISSSLIRATSNEG